MPITGTYLIGTLIPFPLPPPEPFNSLVLFVLSSGGGVLAHLATSFVLAFPVPPSAIKVCLSHLSLLMQLISCFRNRELRGVAHFFHI